MSTDGEVIIKSYNGIGDLLFVTPTLRRIKEAYPGKNIIVNTNYPYLVKNNPHVDAINVKDQNGIFLGYPDPIHCIDPTKHHILSDWDVVERAMGLKIPEPELQPEIYINAPAEKRHLVGVQLIHKGHWHKKKVWPEFSRLAHLTGFEQIPKVRNIKELVYLIASYNVVVCAEGGISHIAKAVGTQAVVIYGGFASPEWNGYEDQHNLTNKLWCSYCYNTQPCLEEPERKCLREIKIEEVVNAVEQMLRTGSPSN